ncbi:bacterioferritin [Mycobacteroides franklinii]|uniref:Ferritin n=1 Tax=Mycobacteroides franklinii TaxID=948102 RepID=A0A1S1L6Q6_9MYCO|nr:ferritin [Mycobacteroides franklinii]NGX05770.1 bacterioferritin [Mycobacteroides franklinii]OHU21105.1 bacterioferritin [Mycobacteroides franklinii]
MATTDPHARASSPFLELLHDQIRNEFTASQQYIAIAVYYDDADLPQLAKRFYAQAVEERTHAMMIIRYLIDKNVAVTIPGVDPVINGFADAREPIALALEQEKRVTDQITALARAARSSGDYYGEQFMQWFLKEQVEEVATMDTLLTVVDRADHDLFDLENFVERELNRPVGQDPTAPRAAGEAP